MWDVRGQSATLVLDMKEHKKAVTCFSLFEPGDGLLSGSADKTIRVCQAIYHNEHYISLPGCTALVQSDLKVAHVIFFHSYGRWSKRS